MTSRDDKSREEQFTAWLKENEYAPYSSRRDDLWRAWNAGAMFVKSSTAAASESIADKIPKWFEGGTTDGMLDEALAQIRTLEQKLDQREKQLIECQHQLITRNAELAMAMSATTFTLDEHTAMLLAAISTASIQNTRESAKERIGKDNPCWTQAYEDVCTAVDREMALRERLLLREGDKP